MNDKFEELNDELDELLEEELEEPIEARIRGTDQRENAIEWYTGDNRITATVSQMRLKNKIKKYATNYPEEVEIVAENPDGTLLAHMPLKYLHIVRPRLLTEEDRKAASERLKKYWADKKAAN